MPMKQVSTSLFELDQDDKNRETKWWKPLISSSASPHAKGRLLKAPENYTKTPNEIRWAKGLQLGFFPRNPVFGFIFKEAHSQSLTVSVFESGWNKEEVLGA